MFYNILRITTFLDKGLIIINSFKFLKIILYLYAIMYFVTLIAENILNRRTIGIAVIYPIGYLLLLILHKQFKESLNTKHSPNKSSLDILECVIITITTILIVFSLLGTINLISTIVLFSIYQIIIYLKRPPIILYFYYTFLY